MHHLKIPFTPKTNCVLIVLQKVNGDKLQTNVCFLTLWETLFQKKRRCMTRKDKCGLIALITSFAIIAGIMYFNHVGWTLVWIAPLTITFFFTWSNEDSYNIAGISGIVGGVLLGAWETILGGQGYSSIPIGWTLVFALFYPWNGKGMQIQTKCGCDACDGLRCNKHTPRKPQKEGNKFE